MIELLIFSKGGVDLIMFKPEFNSDVDAILSLENKTIRDLELRDNVVIGQLCKEVVKSV